MNDFGRLMDAAKSGDEGMVLSVLQGDSEAIHQRDEVGATALHYAALGGHRRIVQLLVEHGGDINARDGRHGATPAGWAIEYPAALFESHGEV